MRKLFLALMATAAVASIALTGCKEKNPAYDEKADCLIIGNVITMDEANPSAKAVTVKNGLVQYVGELDEARKYCDDKTRVLDYGTASVYPGFIEGHVHGMEVATRTSQLDLSEQDDDPQTTMWDFLAAIKAYVQANPELDLYKGAGWTVHHGVQPTRQMLDSICDTKPMIFSTVDGHSMWINTFAIEKYGVSNAENIKKYGTDCIRVDASGYPTGYISEAAMDLVRPALLLSKEEYMDGLRQWQAMAFSYGITAVLEAALPVSGTHIQEAFRELAQSGEWKLRTYASEVIQYPMPDDIFYRDINLIKQHHDNNNLEYYKTYGIKIFLDGVVEAHTAWLLEPYTDDPSYYGLQAFPYPDRITEAVAFANQNGMNAHFHCIGDAAVRTAVDAIVKAQNQTGITDKRNTIAHLQIVQPEEIDKMAQNHIIPVVAPLWAPIEPDYFSHEVAYLGNRAYEQYPIKSFFDKGCCVTFHSDYPVSPNISMPKTIYAAVTRTDERYGEAGIHNINEAVTREQALKAITVNAAYQLSEENRLGQLKAGFVANMSVYDADFLKDDMSKVYHASTVATIIDGNVVFGK